MSQIKLSFMKQIYDAFKSSKFTIADFDFSFPSSGNTLIIVKFKHHPEYRLELSERTGIKTVKVKDGFSRHFQSTREEENKYTAYSLLESPGKYKLEESNEIDSPSEIITKIPNWCHNIHSDICTKLETEDDFSVFRNQLEEIIQFNFENENSSFETHEIEALEKKFDMLQEMFNKLEEQNTITEENLEQVKKEINEIKNNSNVYPKGMWAKVTKNKLIKMLTDFAKTKEGRELFIEGIKRLITNGNITSL